MINRLRKKYAEWKEKETPYKGYVLISSFIAVAVLMLLQPFGLDNNIPHKGLIILGYGGLTALACLIANVLTTKVFKQPRDLYTMFNRNSVIYTLLMNILMAAFISSYAALVYTGDIANGWFYKDGTFTLNAFWMNLKASLSVTVLIVAFWIFRKQNFVLKMKLKEAIQLNAILAERQQQKKQAPADDTLVETAITLQGSTKESLTLSPTRLLFIEAEGNYVHIHYVDEEGHEQKKALRCTIKQMETAFESQPTIARCHRAFIVNTERVNHVNGNSQGYRLTLEGTANEVPVSRAYAPTVYQLIEG